MGLNTSGRPRRLLPTNSESLTPSDEATDYQYDSPGDWPSDGGPERLPDEGSATAGTLVLGTMSPVTKTALKARHPADFIAAHHGESVRTSSRDACDMGPTNVARRQIVKRVQVSRRIDVAAGGGQSENWPVEHRHAHVREGIASILHHGETIARQIANDEDRQAHSRRTRPNPRFGHPTVAASGLVNRRGWLATLTPRWLPTRRPWTMPRSKRSEAGDARRARSPPALVRVSSSPVGAVTTTKVARFVR